MGVAIRRFHTGHRQAPPSACDWLPSHFEFAAPEERVGGAVTIDDRSGRWRRRPGGDAHPSAVEVVREFLREQVQADGEGGALPPEARIQFIFVLGFSRGVADFVATTERVGERPVALAGARRLTTETGADRSGDLRGEAAGHERIGRAGRFAPLRLGGARTVVGGVKIANGPVEGQAVRGARLAASGVHAGAEAQLPARDQGARYFRKHAGIILLQVGPKKVDGAWALSLQAAFLPRRIDAEGELSEAGRLAVHQYTRRETAGASIREDQRRRRPSRIVQVGSGDPDGQAGVNSGGVRQRPAVAGGEGCGLGVPGVQRQGGIHCEFLAGPQRAEAQLMLRVGLPVQAECGADAAVRRWHGRAVTRSVVAQMVRRQGRAPAPAALRDILGHQQVAPVATRIPSGTEIRRMRLAVPARRAQRQVDIPGVGRRSQCHRGQ